MRLKRRRRRNRSSNELWALFAIGTVALAAGCQGPQFDHVDGSSSTFNANRIPSVDHQPVAETKSPTGKTPAATTDDAAVTQTAASAPANDESVAENLNRGHREAALNHLEQAEACYRRVLEREPENPVANHRLAVIADKKHDYARAEGYYLAALHRDGRNPDLLGDLGYSYLLQGRREESERYLLDATRIDPSHAKALHNLSLLYAKDGDFDRSFDALRRAVGDSEARVKITRLFPNGRPSATDGDEMIASFQPSSVQPSAKRDENSPPATDGSNNVAPPVWPQTSPPIVATEPAWPTAPVTTSAAAPRSDEPNSAPNARVADSHINDIFAAIDREESRPAPTASVTSAASVSMQAQPVPPAQQTTAGTTGTTAGGFDAHDLQSAPGTDPLASMPLWPPATATSPRRSPSAAFTYDAGGTRHAPTQGTPSPQLPGPRPNQATLPSSQPADAPLPFNDPDPASDPQKSLPAVPLGQDDLGARRSAALTNDLPDFDAKSPTITAGPLPEVAADSSSKAPRAIPTGIVVPAGAVADKPREASARTSLSDYKVELQREWGTSSGVRTQSNAGGARDPLIVPRPAPSGAAAANPFSPPGDATSPQPIDATAPGLRNQPRNNPAPLFEPVEGFGPTSDFPPADNTPIPAWPSTNGNTPATDSDGGPAIRPRSSN